ncbi:hypothetical protein BDZ97DRAFT_1355743 [Flammula alnicola]|nr:hypothetical protein BDZ97DRAFT_1355743 [Flammula alnicola]
MGTYDSHFGPLLIGAVLNTCIFGFSCLQTLHYLRSFPADPWQLRSFVILVWTLEFAHSALAVWAVYSCLVTNFADVASADSQMHFTMSIAGVFSVTITSLVQCYFAFRLHMLSKFVIIPATSAILAILRPILYLRAMLRLHHRTPGWNWTMFTTATLSLISDLLVTGSLSLVLLRRGRSEGPLRVSGIVDRIIIISIQANAFTCTVMSISLLAYIPQSRLDGHVTCRLQALFRGLSPIVCPP